MAVFFHGWLSGNKYNNEQLKEQVRAAAPSKTARRKSWVSEASEFFESWVFVRSFY